MIQLFIDNEEVFVNDNQNIEIHDQNPLITKSGEYSYDIDINLMCAENRKAYLFIDRINQDSLITGRKARLLVDGRTVCSGTETILELNQNTVKIQIVGGNSELNFLGSNLTVKELDLGVVQPITADWAMQTLSGRYPDYPGVCCPVMLQLTENPKAPDIEIVNKIKPDTSSSIQFEDKTRFILQPYFLTVLDRILSALGWSVAYNVLANDDFASRLICIHAFDTLNLNEMVPNWAVDKFISEVEKFFNVIFVCDTSSQSISIYRVHEFYKSHADTVIVDAKDILSQDMAPSVKFGQEDELYTNYNNIRYNFPKEWYYNYSDIAEEVLEVCKVLEFSDYLALLAYPEFTYNKPILCYVKDMDTYFTSVTDLIFSYYRIVNQFAHVIQDETQNDFVEFDICPAEVIGCELKPTYGETRGFVGAALPFARNQVNQDQQVTEESGLNQWIQEGYPSDYDSSGNNLFLAYYGGFLKVANGASADDPLWQTQDKCTYPQCITYPYYKVHFDAYGSFEGKVTHCYSPISFNEPELRERITFNLKYIYQTNYSKNLFIDTTTLYEIRFRYKSRPSATALFNISNRLFYCKELVYSVENNKMPVYVTGYFYPIK